MSRPPGMRVGPYCLLRHLRSGGTAEVYEAVHTHLDVTVALKLLSPAMAANPQMVARFLQESRALAQIQHPGVVQVQHSDSDESELAYVAMEILAGQSLRDALRTRGGRLPATEVIEIGSQVSDAMVAVHAVGIVHRDIKPENLFLIDPSEDPQALCVKVIDFGISKVPSRQRAADDPVQLFCKNLDSPQCASQSIVLGSAWCWPTSFALFAAPADV